MKFQQRDQFEQIQKWEQQMKDSGFVDNESEILKFLQEIDLNHQSNHSLASQLITLLALSMAAKGGKESLVLAWMEKAIRLDPNNLRANQYVTNFDWERSMDLFDVLVFPPIRETDHTQARKQNVQLYISICQQFLINAEEKMESLTNMKETLNHMDSISLYNDLKTILEQAIDGAALLLKAATDYENSMIGSFHTAAHYDEMKLHLAQLEDLKKQWAELFVKEESDKEEEDERALHQLNELIGLESVKMRVNDYYQFFSYQKLRSEKGFQTKDEVSLNMILTGNPGTGKTTIARLFSGMYYEVGVLPRKEVIEVDRSQLVGAYVGQTEENVRNAVEKALGGVLFIDEAYNLKREGQTGNDYGQVAIDTLVSLMTSKEYGGKFAVILAGYPEEMRLFLDSNPGLRSRFPMSNLLTLPDYTNEELILIGERFAAQNDYILTDEGKIALEDRIEKERVDDTFGNARTVRNIILDAIFNKGAHHQSNQDDIFAFSLLDKEDFNKVAMEEKVEHSMKLDQLVGLENVKEEVQSIVSFVKMQTIRRNHGLPIVPIQLHSVFTGNPGTGKTTVAKIYAELLKECGLLKRGHLIVTSRADFVAGYVGQTALKTKRKIREALGGVLFIDEAYSLLGQTAGDFGKEVIDTLVDEMTKHNENLVVILAGYSNEMEKLLESNPGLKSRFKKFIEFKDYSSIEILEIMKLYSKQFDFYLTQEAEDFTVTKLGETPVEGNGRFATNLVNEAIQAQAQRLMGKNEPISSKEATIIEKNDIEIALEKMANS